MKRVKLFDEIDWCDDTSDGDSVVLCAAGTAYWWNVPDVKQIDLLLSKRPMAESYRVTRVETDGEGFYFAYVDGCRTVQIMPKLRDLLNDFGLPCYVAVEYERGDDHVDFVD